MIRDTQNEFSDSQAVTATAISTNVYDTQSEDQSNTVVDLGAGGDLYLVVEVDAAATAAGSATVTFTLESDSTANLATSATTHFSSSAIGKADLTIGARPVVVKLPAGDYERYLGVRYTVGTGPLTAGAFSAYLVDEVNLNKAYASGFSI